MSEKYERGSRKDALTDLLDRDGFDREMAHAVLHTPGEFALVIIDIRAFKSVNTEYGHPEGDKFLKNLADVLKLILREDDCILFRIGGDEFSILLRGVDPETGVYTILERITTKLDELGIEVSIDAGIHRRGESAKEFEIRVDALTEDDRRKGINKEFPPEQYGDTVREIGRLATRAGIPDRILETLLIMQRNGQYS